MTAEVWGMQSARLPDFADRLASFLQNFADRSGGRVTVDGLIDRIRGADAQVWVVGDFKAVAITHAGDEYVSIDFCSGSDRIEWQDALEAEIAAWAKFNGRKRLFIAGRPGWSKWAKGKGYRESHREMCKELV